MRIYLINVQPMSVDAAELNAYKVDHYSVRTLVSEEGLFSVTDGKTKRLAVRDRPTEALTIAKHSAIVDRSELVVVDGEVGRVPATHMCSDWHYTKYKLSDRSQVALVIGESEGSVGDMYFDVSADQFTHSVAEDACAFLAKLKLC